MAEDEVGANCESNRRKLGKARKIGQAVRLGANFRIPRVRISSDRLQLGSVRNFDNDISQDDTSFGTIERKSECSDAAENAESCLFSRRDK